MTLTEPGEDFGVGAAAMHIMFFEPHYEWKDTFR